MKALSFSLAFLLFTGSVSASDNLNVTMKKMRVAFKQAAEAQSIEEMKTPLAELDVLIQHSKQGQYPEEKRELYMSGFNKLSAVVDIVESEVEQGNLEQAKEALREIDELRVEYHKKRNPSIWSRLFS
ncbi:cytochrome b562 [Vibrio sp. Of7-15]|uniref:cytochrome b562 n=1 Tax=Vibrio sp. Of7-15 TaxID=2724879 RepID=UPI001EF27BC2|nr:cytochrome b562 [Vibrio sp. Of7-15]MCG7496481.1 cytochrome b562 [Vibrio sp. Of7-15]